MTKISNTNKGFGSLYIFVPSNGEIIYLRVGCGDQLDKEDIENGYVAYVDYTQFVMEAGNIKPGDAGIMLLKENFQTKYSRTEDCILELLEYIYDKPSTGYTVLLRA